MIKLIATDMDGTFLDDDKNYDYQRFNDIYKQLKEKNILFCIASGRQMIILKEDFAEIADELLIMAENGSYIARGNQPLYAMAMNKQSYLQIGRILSQFSNLVPVLSGMNHCYILTTHQQYIPLIDPFYHALIAIDDFQQIDDTIFKVSVLNITAPDNSHAQEITAQLSDDLTTMVTGFEWYDVVQKQTNKGAGLKAIQEYYHISPEETMIFGDEQNDMTMYDYAKYSYAMANASPVIKEKAYAIAPSNNEQGVLSVIEDYLKTIK